MLGCQKWSGSSRLLKVRCTDVMDCIGTSFPGMLVVGASCTFYHLLTAVLHGRELYQFRAEFRNNGPVVLPYGAVRRHNRIKNSAKSCDGGSTVMWLANGCGISLDRTANQDRCTRSKRRTPTHHYKASNLISRRFSCAVKAHGTLSLIHI